MNRDSFIIVLYGVSGYFAAFMKYYEDIRAFDVYSTGIGGYNTFEEAEVEAQEWAIEEEVTYERNR